MPADRLYSNVVSLVWILTRVRPLGDASPGAEWRVSNGLFEEKPYLIRLPLYRVRVWSAQL